MAEIAKELRERLRQAIERDMDRVFMSSVAGTTNQVAEPAKPFNLREAMHEWDKLLREARRAQVTFRVDLAHLGPMTKHEMPNDGTVFEMSFSQAQDLHRHWPLKLHKVLDEHAAEFVPGCQFDQFLPVFLPMPPFDLPDVPSLPSSISNG